MPLHGENRIAREQHIAIMPAMLDQIRARNRLVARKVGEEFGLRFTAELSLGPPIDFLQADHRCADLADHLCDALRVMAPVRSDGAMDVVGGSKKTVEHIENLVAQRAGPESRSAKRRQMKTPSPAITASTKTNSRPRVSLRRRGRPIKWPLA